MREVLRVAASEAFARNHTHLGTEHILLALAALDDDLAAARALRELGFDLATARAQLDATAGQLPERTTPALRPEGVTSTPAVQRLTGRAEGLMLACGDRELTPEHLLVAMLWQGSGLCLSILRDQGISTTAVHHKLREFGVKATPDEPSEYIRVRWGERVTVSVDQLRLVVRHLPKMLPPDTTFACNYEGDHAYVVATEGVDLPELVEQIVSAASEE
jgi:ATP-dependent Clp protease ATP-binding subunit ClpA